LWVLQPVPHHLKNQNNESLNGWAKAHAKHDDADESDDDSECLAIFLSHIGSIREIERRAKWEGRPHLRQCSQMRPFPF